MYKLYLLVLLSACSSFNPKNLTQNSTLKAPFNNSVNKNIKLDCHNNVHCSAWKEWLNEIVLKSPKHKIDKSFYKNVPTHYPRFTYFYDLIKNLEEIEISYGDFHCLDDQISCTFMGEKKIFFNLRATSLSKIDWMRIFWHEVFHLTYPDIDHCNCKTCPDKSSRLYEICDKTPFSSFGFERYWVKTQAYKFSTDKNFKRHKQTIVFELSNRICR